MNDREKHHDEISLFFFLFFLSSLSYREYVGAVEETSSQRKAEEIVNWNPRKKHENRRGVSYFTIVPDNLTVYMAIR